MWRSEPQIAQAVILMIASRGCSIFGSGTSSQRMSALPCQVSALKFLLRCARDARLAIYPNANGLRREKFNVPSPKVGAFCVMQLVRPYARCPTMAPAAANGPPLRRSETHKKRSARDRPLETPPLVRAAEKRHSGAATLNWDTA